jgi:hypothetical protein
MSLSRFTASLLTASVLAFAPAALADNHAKAPGETAAPVRSSITGDLAEIQDAGYPMAILIMNVPDVGAGSEYTINLEAAAIEGGDINALKGKQVTLTLETAIEPVAVDVTFEGKSVMAMEGEQPPAVEPGDKTITGILSGVPEPTASDLPSLAAVTAKDGTKVEFEVYADDRMAAANGKEVTLRYVMADRTDVVEVAKVK